MIYSCPNLDCHSTTKNKLISKDGFFFRRSDSRKIQRFVCKTCGRKFSRATFTLEKYQKKRRINRRLFLDLATNSSMRSCARKYKVNYKTVQSRMDYFSIKGKKRQEKFLKKLEKSKVQAMQFDDLVTSEHTKMKPLSITIAVDKKRRHILAAEVSSIPAFGLLADKSRKKYGYRKSDHERGLEKVFEKIKNVVNQDATIQSDEHQAYPKFVSRYFPKAEYKRYKGGRGCVAGQGELKKLRFDPLFTLNHTCAMFRANINRLARRTWCTTKRIDMLQKHVDIFINYYNSIYLRDAVPI
ncbi:IS1 family transposase [Bacteriovorax sp. Seq25_V]|uniref:IS1 family transposase n=1 Tax=Bacteriovorax sp. Seq25_V TaxID=1201288 RepID=UPI0018DFCB25|nr:IS1 family transposase [Bacteriovorax sp. Seq25_V]